MGDAVHEAITRSAPRPPTTGLRRLRVTTPEDGPFVPRMYSYWANAWVEGETAIVFLGHVDGRPRFFRVHLTTGTAVAVDVQVAHGGTTEGWSWDARGWITLCDGPRLHRIHPLTGADDILLDISQTHPGCDLWQAHSSDDGQVHSATVRQIVDDGPYLKRGTIVARPQGREWFEAHGALDEAQISRNGRWLLIKENDDNRIIDLETGVERLLVDADGALGHSDCGPDYAVGENNQIGACVYLDLASAKQWTLFSTWSMGYVSVRGGKCLHSSDTELALVDLVTGQRTVLLSHGGGTDYDTRVKANLDPTGQVACYMASGVVYLLVLP